MADAVLWVVLAALLVIFVTALGIVAYGCWHVTTTLFSGFRKGRRGRKGSRRKTLPAKPAAKRVSAEGKRT